MEVSERELEDICIAVMMTKEPSGDPDGVWTSWGPEMARRMFEEFTKTGGVIFHVVPNQD